MNILAVFIYSIGTLGSILVHQAIAATGDTLQVISHQLTLRPQASQVTTSPQDGCQDTATYRQCEGELSGRRYTWAQENQMTNYILFILSRRASISEVNLIYSVSDSSETPKVSVCAALNDANISNAFGIGTSECKEISIVATGGANRTDTILMPFSNITNRVALEIITQGIKASFTATAVQLFGTVEATETVSTLEVPTISGTDSNGLTESIFSNSTADGVFNGTTNGVSLSLTQASKVNVIVSLCVALGLMTYYK